MIGPGAAPQVLRLTGSSPGLLLRVWCRLLGAFTTLLSGLTGLLLWSALLSSLAGTRLRLAGLRRRLLHLAGQDRKTISRLYFASASMGSSSKALR